MFNTNDLIFDKRTFKAEKGVKVVPPTKLEKIVGQGVKFFESVPQLAPPPIGFSTTGNFLPLRI